MRASLLRLLGVVLPAGAHVRQLMIHTGLTGPVGHIWYEVLDKAARRRFAPGTLKFIATKVVGDEILFGPVHVAGFFAFMTAAEGGSWQVRLLKLPGADDPL